MKLRPHSTCYFFALTICFLLMDFVPCSATHIRAGEIIAKRQSCDGFTYTINLIGYTDTGASFLFGNGTLYFGDGTSLDLNEDMVAVEPYDEKLQIAKNTVTIQHTFTGPGIYTLYYLERNRNADIINMDNSVVTPFYIESLIIIDPAIGCNSAPILSIPPVDKGCQQKAFTHNPGAYDAEGDSISYAFVLPKQDPANTVTNYRYPNAKEFYDLAGIDYLKGNANNDGPPTFELNQNDGTLLWDAPGLVGEYNFAFKIIEWRKINGEWLQIGYVVRDMQVVIEDCAHEPPTLEIPEDLCIEIGNSIHAVITAKSGPPVSLKKQTKLEAFCQLFDLPTSIKANFTVAEGFQPSPVTGTFNWETIDCAVVRKQPYQVFFKATDLVDGAIGLSSYATWNITVLASAPEFKKVEREGRTASLSWHNYQKAYDCYNAEKIEVWRKIEGNNYSPESCETGIRANSGYQKIAELAPSDTLYKDVALNFAAKYCYRLLAIFPEPNGGESIVSTEICTDPIEATAPIPTHVTVEKTAEDEGEIRVSWRSPFDLDPIIFPPPYTYQVHRSKGLSGAERELVYTGTDTSFVDTKLATANEAYNYTIQALDGNSNPLKESIPASSVWLTPTPNIRSIQLNWEANVPWSNQIPGLPHTVYRTHTDPNDASVFNEIGKVASATNGMQFTDNGAFLNMGLDPNKEYCYYIATAGSYGNSAIESPQINLSQIECARLKDDIPPCAPIVEINPLTCRPINNFDTSISFDSDDLDCSNEGLQNTLTWQLPDSSCGEDIHQYKVFFKSSLESDFMHLATVKTTSFVHDNLTSFARCYQVVAVDASGNESAPSESVCKDNCPNFYLPNIFTPGNSDGFNDVFRTFDANKDQQVENIQLKCPKFVAKVEFLVVNLWGRQVYQYTSGGEKPTTILWDGKDDNGHPLPSGIYNYKAIVTFNVLDPKLRTRTFKGWVDLKR